MSKKKNPMALYDILSRKESPSGSMHVPDWAKKPVARPGAPRVEDGEEPPALEEVEEESLEIEDPDDEESVEELPASQEEPDEPDIDEDQPPAFEDEPEELEEMDEPLLGQESPELADSCDHPPLLCLRGERLEISINFVIAMAVLGGLGVLLVGSFVVGRMTSPAPTGQETPKAAQAEPLPNIAPMYPIDGEGAKPTLARSGYRNANRSYLVIETLKGNRDADFKEARRIIQFCAERNIPADFVQMGSPPNQKIAVWCLLGFDSHRSGAAVQHAKNVEKIGAEYFKKHQTYKFLQRKGDKDKFRPFFVSGKAEDRPE